MPDADTLAALLHDIWREGQGDGEGGWIPPSIEVIAARLIASGVSLAAHPPYPMPADFDAMSDADFWGYLDRIGVSERIRAAKAEPVSLAAPAPVEGLREWQALATDYSEALLRLGHHQRAKHEAPHQYDSDSSLACTAPACLGALAASPPAPEGLDVEQREPLGNAVRYWRELADLTQRGLAERVAADFTYLSKIENGRDVPSLALIERIDAATGAEGQLIEAWQGTRCPACGARLAGSQEGSDD